MSRLEGKHVLVTAAAQGIGRACVETFLREGATVHATDVDAKGLSTLPQGRLKTAVLDGTDPQAVADFVAGLNPLHSVVHCIGYVHQGSVLDCDQEHWQRSFRVNVDSFYYVLRAALPPMVTAQAGSIVCIASVASSIKGLPNRAAYGATKAALIGLVKSVAADYVAQGIRCNAVCPGTVTSPSLLGRMAEVGKSLGDLEKARAMFISRQPMNRLGTPEEIAALCLYLASDESRFVTGQAMAIDGGITI